MIKLSNYENIITECKETTILWDNVLKRTNFKVHKYKLQLNYIARKKSADHYYSKP